MKEDEIDLTGCLQYSPCDFREAIREIRSLIVNLIQNLADDAAIDAKELGNVLYTLQFLGEDVKLVDNKYKKP